MSGKFIFQAIQEGSDESLRQIYFNPPLVIEYSIYDKIDKDTGKECYPEDVPMMGYATFDFGMEIHIPLDIKNNWLTTGNGGLGYEGLTVESDPIDVVMKTIWFDLFHAFFHPSEDPNYSHYHWALRGWLEERASVKEVG